MTTILTILHVLVCLALIGIVLLQHGKGADIGATFGGSSQTLFGSTGATTFLGKLTAVAAVLFMVTSLGLGLLDRSSGPDQGYTDVPASSAPAPEQPMVPPAPVPAPAPAAPEAPAK